MKRLGGRNAAKGAARDGWRRLQEEILRFRDARDWKQFHNPKDLAAAVAIEVGELQEHFLWRTPAEIEAALQEPGKLRAVHDELADVLICALLCADALGADVEKIVRAKLRTNAIKYPVRKAKGSSRKYTELDGR